MKKLLTLFTLLLCVCSGAWGQTLIESDNMESTSGSGSSLTVSGFSKGDCTISQSTEARTGSYSLKTEYNGTGEKAAKTTNTSINVAANEYLHVIAWAKLESTDETAASSNTQARPNAYIGGNGNRNAVNLTTTWQQITSNKKTNNAVSNAYVLLQRKHAAKKAVLFDDVVIYTSTNETTDIVAPTAATSASATASAISWTSGTDANTGIQKTLIFKRTSGSSDNLTFNNQAVYSLTASEGPSTDQSGNWTLVAVVNGDATSYEAALDGSTRYAIVHRDLAYNYSTPTYVTTPSTVTYEVTYKANNGTEEADVVENVATVGDCPNTFSVPTGKIFAGWNTEANGSGDDYAVGEDVTSALTLFAQWEEIVYYTVTLNPNGGEIADATGWTLDNGQYKKENIVSGTELALPTFTKTDNTFMTWRDGSGNEYNSPVTVNSDLTITAIWGKEIEKIIYSWESPEGTAIETGGTATHYNGSSPVDGNTRVNYANTANSTTYYTICLNGKTDYSTDHIRFVLDEVIKTGDEVRVTAYCNKNESANASAKMDTQSDTEIFADDVNLPNIYSSGSPVLRTYIIPEGINTNEIKMTRNQAQTATFITKLQIVRTEVVETVSGTISEAGWNTFSSNYALDLSTITGGAAYVATTNDNTEVTLTETSAKVAAGTGLMIKGTAGATFTISTTTDAATLTRDNLLVGLPNGGTVAANDYNYVFAWTTGSVSTAGFWYVNDAEPTLGAGKAYLHSVGSNGAKLNIIIDNGETTSISEELRVKSEESSSAYNLAGQKVCADYKGIVIVNGKKYLRK